VDVAVVGGGFTGLWTALHLLRMQPRIRVVVLEARRVGFGASGRCGGWVSDAFPASDTAVSRTHGDAVAAALRSMLRSAVDDVGRFCEEESVDFVKSGSLLIARNRAQEQRVRARVLGHDEVLLSGDDVSRRVDVAGALCGIWSPHCGVVQPMQLVRGLAAAVERHGGVIHEHSRVTSIRPGVVSVGDTCVHAGAVVQATEGYSHELLPVPHVPLFTYCVATEPLSPAVWQRLRWHAREAVAEASHHVTYAQRSHDGRVVIGGVSPRYGGSGGGGGGGDGDSTWPWVQSRLVALARSWFPLLRDARFTHHWGGAMGVTRDSRPYLLWDGSTRVGIAGGYLGDGVAMSFVAGRRLAQHVLGCVPPRGGSDDGADAFDGFVNARWEPEPVRAAAFNAVFAALRFADFTEARTGKPSVIARLVDSVAFP
jgi:glycine/D-amino acid oxidase-like deaminating enzyme